MIGRLLGRVLGRADFVGPLTAPPARFTARDEAVLVDEALAAGRLVEAPLPIVAPAEPPRRIGRYMEFHS